MGPILKLWSMPCRNTCIIYLHVCSNPKYEKAAVVPKCLWFLQVTQPLIHVSDFIYMYMEIHVHSTLAKAEVGRKER